MNPSLLRLELVESVLRTCSDVGRMTANIICIISNSNLRRNSASLISTLKRCVNGSSAPLFRLALCCSLPPLQSRLCGAEPATATVLLSWLLDNHSNTQGTQRQGARAAIIAASISGGNGGEIRTQAGAQDSLPLSMPTRCVAGQPACFVRRRCSVQGCR